MSDDAPVDAPKALTVLPAAEPEAASEPARGWTFICDGCGASRTLDEPDLQAAILWMRQQGNGVYAGGSVVCACCCDRIARKLPLVRVRA